MSPATTYGSALYRWMLAREPGPLDAGPRPRSVDRLERLKQLARFVAVPQFRESDQRPNRRVRVLAAVFPDSRNVALDVPGIMRGVIKRRRQEQGQPGRSPDQMVIDRSHSPHSARRLRRAADDSPGLSNRVDAAFRVGGRAERCSIVVVGATVPLAVPAIAFERGL